MKLLTEDTFLESLPSDPKHEITIAGQAGN